MSAFGQAFENRLAEESWTFYGIGVVFVAVRSYARIRKLGVGGLEIDDYLMYLALGFYTMVILCLNITAAGAGSALALPGEDVYTFSEKEIKARAYGAKIDLLAEQGMLNTIWVLKACMLLLYNRLTLGVRKNLAVKILAVYCAVGYVACQLAFFLQCRPFYAYWQIVPTPNIDCETLWTYAAVQCTFNISSDIAMLFVPLPLIIGVKVPLRQKLVLVVIFSMGLFVIAAALCTKIEFWISIYSADYMFWYTRESSVAMYVANLPCIWPLLRENIRMLRSFSGGTYSKSGTVTGNGKGTALRSMRGHGTVNEVGLDTITGQEVNMAAGVDHADATKMGFKQPAITTKRYSRDSDENALMGLGDGIRAETTIEIDVVERDSESEKDRYISRMA